MWGIFQGKARRSAEAIARTRDWGAALAADRLPDHVAERLATAGAGRSAWVATMTPAELRLARSHGIRPIATVSGTCWFSYGRSWTEGHAQGWHEALDRIAREAAAAGANAVVDVRLRTLRHTIAQSMDFTLVGTAVRIKGLRPSPHPVVATVPALEFVRLLDADIVPVGIAVGARYEWLGNGGWGSGDAGRWGGNWSDGSAIRATQRAEQSWTSQPMGDLMAFWEAIRRQAHAELRRNAARQGNGVLAHTHFGQLLKQERDKAPPAFLGRHIVIGTVVDTRRGSSVPAGITPVVDMRDTLSPLLRTTPPPTTAYSNDIQDQEGAI